MKKTRAEQLQGAVKVAEGKKRTAIAEATQPMGACIFVGFALLIGFVGLIAIASVGMIALIA